MLDGKGYIACAHFEETIRHFGESSSPESALDNFVNSGEFIDYCDCRDIPDKTLVTVKVFQAIYAESPDANPDDFEDGWGWILGDEVSSHQILYSVNKKV